MTVQELQEIMNQRFDRVEDDVKELRADMKKFREKMDADMKELREKMDAALKELREKLDKLLELQHYQRGQHEFSSRFSNMPHGWDRQSSRSLRSSKVSFRGMQY